ncbi:DUF1648 domain-containing protein [Aureivirga sp. CE67]|uniref:DUF1648 domain-containing protein n=1 Tax=Aureivirga sp. CE67 TaxID=1788983 RepID=UPI0018CA35F1|nr:DUF1648 domain-containing protein [Aureivirga sp. CE67]
MNQRPRIKIEPSLFDKIIIFSSWSIIILLIFFTFHYYSELPEKIPTNFNSTGNATGYRGKMTLWYMVIVLTLINILFQSLSRIPEKFNYIVKITKENAKKQYTLNIRILYITSLLVSILFAYIFYQIIAVALNYIPKSFEYSGEIIVGISILYVIAIIYLIIKNK